MSHIVYTQAKLNIALGNINFSADTFKILLTNGYVPDVDNDIYVSAVDHEVSAGSPGYSRQTVTFSLSADSTNHRANIDAADVTWTTANFAADGAVLYKYNGGDSIDQLIAFFDFGAIKSSSYTDFVIQWSNSEYVLNVR
jgi:hypothetical protein